jgi:CRP-like cAMP-binding protein
MGNLILRGLPRNEGTGQVFSSLELVRFKPHQILHEAGETIRSGFFLNDGLASVLSVQPGGQSVEVGSIGKDGFVGLPVIVGFKTSGVRIVTQMDCTAYRIDADALRRLLPQCPELELQLQRFSTILRMQSMQLAIASTIFKNDWRVGC